MFRPSIVPAPAPELPDGLLAVRLPLWLWVVVPLVAALCYANALPGGFVFDDRPAIEDNLDLRPETPLADLFRHDFWGMPIGSPRSHKSYRPVTVLTFRLDYRLHGLAPQGYHLTNALLHAAASALALAVGAGVLGDPRAAGAAALLFAAHPVHTDAVTSVVGRAELLCGVFFMGGLLAYMRAARTEGTRRRWMALSLVLATLAMLSKETGVTLLATLLLYEVLRPGPPGTVRRWPAPVGRAALLVLLGAGYALLRHALSAAEVPPFAETDNPAAFAGGMGKVLSAAYAHARYAWLLLWPMRLSADYSFDSIPLVTSLADVRNLASLTLYAGLAAALVLALRSRHRRALLFALGLSAVTFLPVSHLLVRVPMFIAERTLYLPSLGYCLLAGWGLSSLAGRGRAGARFAAAVFVAVFLFYAARTVTRNPVWRDNERLFANVLETFPRNVKALLAIGSERIGQKRYDEALAHFQKALSIRPRLGEALFKVGKVHYERDAVEEAERLFRQAIDADPSCADAHNHLGIVTARKGRLAEALGHFQRAIWLQPSTASYHKNLGNALYHMQRYGEAITAFEEALRRRPDIGEAWTGIGLSRRALGDETGAREAFDREEDRRR